MPFGKAVFTPDGTGITFSRLEGENCFLYRATIATGRAVRVTQNSSGCEDDPAYSPDGKQLVYTRSRSVGNRAEIVLAGVDGTSQQTLVPSDADNLKPLFVPHSSEVLFLRSGAFKHSSPLANNRRHDFDVFAVNLQNKQVRAITHQHFYDLERLDVSPDGKQLVYSLDTYPEGNRFLIAPLSSPEKPASGLQPQVPDGPKPASAVFDASWFPDGHSLLFQAATQPPDGGNFNYEVYRIAADGTKLERLSILTGLIDGLSLSPDGTRAVILQRGTYLILDVKTREITPLKLDFK